MLRWRAAPHGKLSDVGKGTSLPDLAYGRGASCGKRAALSRRRTRFEMMRSRARKGRIGDAAHVGPSEATRCRTGRGAERHRRARSMASIEARSPGWSSTPPLTRQRRPRRGCWRATSPMWMRYSRLREWGCRRLVARPREEKLAHVGTVPRLGKAELTMRRPPGGMAPGQHLSPGRICCLAAGAPAALSYVLSKPPEMMS